MRIVSMSRPMYKVSLQSIGLAIGLGMVVSMGGAIAAEPNTTSNDSLTKPQREDVEVDTKTEGDESTTTTTGSASDNRTVTQAARFSCELFNGQHTVMYHPKSQPNESYPWATPSAMGSGWSPERRCNEISRRLETYRPDGLQELQTAVENNYNTICVTTQKDRTCRIVLTVPPGQSADITRDRVFENLTIADSGKTTEGVNTFVGGGKDSELLDRMLGAAGLPGVGKGIGSIGGNSMRANGINLRPFLDSADGGTGAKLIGGARFRSNSRSTPRRLSPGNFR
jgi:hypothetical protein